MRQRFEVTAQALTDRGLVRSSNQDTFLVDLHRGLFMVADGMGGHAGGEVASGLVTREISRCLEHFDMLQAAQPVAPHPNPVLLKGLGDAVNVASTRIYERSLENPALRGMGTTVTMVRVVDEFAYWAHVGDSRLYLLRSGFIYQISVDHSLVAQQLAAGLITEEEAADHQLRNVITRSVGFQEEEFVDTAAFEVEDGDFLLLCSDGLSGKVSASELAQYVYRYDLASVKPLVDLAKDRGGDDNITVVVVRILARKNEAYA